MLQRSTSLAPNHPLDDIGEQPCQQNVPVRSLRSYRRDLNEKAHRDHAGSSVCDHC